MIRTSLLAGAALAAALTSACATQSKATKTTDAEQYPFLTRPEVRTIWIPDTVEGNRYIEKHRVFIIDKNSSWSKDND